jgi:hypothetical protein
MTDKELLELAAKAAVIEIIQWSGRDVGQESAAIMPHGIEWNPLTDDGDALRLAVKLRMNVFHAGIRVFALDEEGDIEEAEGHELDPYAATRRAITRAAAEIGKVMP